MQGIKENSTSVVTPIHLAGIDWMKVARLVLLSRALDRYEVEKLAPQGKVKYQFSAGGHELIQVLLAQALDRPHDAAAVYYRSRPFLLACGLEPVESLAAGMARQGSPSQGRDVGVVFNLPRRTGPTVLPASGDVGAQYTPAAGWAQAIRYRQQILQEAAWGEAIAVAMGGEGSTAANGFWAALNMVTTLRLPYLFFIEDNHYGLSVPSDLQTPNGDIAANLASFSNLKVLSGDGTHPAQAWELIASAVKHARSGRGACLLRLSVPRLAGHTFIDDQAYKSPEQRAAEAARDPLGQLQAFLIKQGLPPEQWGELVEQTDQEVENAATQAEKLPNPAPQEAARYLFFEGNTPLQGGLRPEGALPSPAAIQPSATGPRINLIDAVRRTLEAEMARNQRILVFGEDVGVKGGVHGATHDMQRHFGSQRVFDTSLSEEAIIGRSTGLALAGLLPVPEIQFRKYADPAHEQINDLGTLRWRTANHFAAPVVVRIAVGFSKKTGDPWHSMTNEAVFAHTLGWRIAFPSNAEDAVGLLRSALRGDDPTFFFEHRALLDSPEARRAYPGDEYSLPFGQAAECARGDQLTLISWGAMLHRCLEAAREFPGNVTVLDLRTLIPWDKETVLTSVRRTGKILIVHEDTVTAGFASEIMAVISEQAFEYLDAPIARLTTPDIPIPFNLGLMESVIPNVERIRTKITDLLRY
jgi:2-oxoisovalerate dehydrogenase E1 component